MLISILSAVIIFGILVVVHEAGHFAMAKRLGVRVIRFSIGYPPKIFGIRRGETEYAIGATPFGGYCRMLGDEVGEEPRPEEIGDYSRELALDLLDAARQHGTAISGNTAEERMLAIARQVCSNGSASSGSLALAADPAAAREIIGRELSSEEAVVLSEINSAGSVDEAVKKITEHPDRTLVKSYEGRSFPTQALWKRALIVLAGPAANIIFAPILLTLVFMYGVPIPLPVVGDVKADLPAHAAGLKHGDVIISINGKPMDTWNEFAETVRSSDGAALKLDVKRMIDGSAVHESIVLKPTRQDEKTVTGKMVPTWVIGVTPSGDAKIQRFGPLDAAVHAVASTWSLTGQLMVGIGSIVTGSTPIREALGGPIRIAQMAGQYAHQGLADAAMFTVMLSIELGIINLLPVPLLDGGHLLFFIFEGARGKPLELKYREMMLQVGLFLLVALMAFVIFNDISHIVQG
jgi:regulator of sigma E protease